MSEATAVAHHPQGRVAEREIRILSATGVCGSGFVESSFERGLALEPTFVGCDAGSTDPGPQYLGTGATAFPVEAIRRDLRIMLRGARRNGIPLIIGSAGTAGGDVQLALVHKIVREIAAESRLEFRLALIHAEQDPAYLKRRLREGRIKPLWPEREYDEAVIDRSAHIVGMMGAEPFIRALQAGADVIVAGRASDTAIYAALPLLQGFPEGLAWHAAKILECGAAAVVNRKTPDCMFAWLRSDHFVIAAPDPALRCTPQSIASHSLYENADPFRLVECSGTLILDGARYEALSDREVRVSGSVFEHAPRYTAKIEGAELAGYQSVLIGSVRDPLIIGQIDDWISRLRERVDARIKTIYGDQLAQDYSIGVRVYGRNGTMGPLEPLRGAHPHEVALLFDATAPSQEIAHALGGIIRHQALHLPIPEWSGLITAVALPFNVLDRGPVYRFNANHVVEPDDPYEMFPMELFDVRGADETRVPA